MRNHASPSLLLCQPGACRTREKEIKKIEKYQSLKSELVPVVVGDLGCISKGFSGWIDTFMILS